MFDIGFWELVVISVVALVVLGPERLPSAIRSLSHWVKLIRSTANSVKNELEQELKLQSLHDELKKVEQLEMNKFAPQLQESLTELKRAAQTFTQTNGLQGQEPVQQASTAMAPSSTANPLSDKSLTEHHQQASQQQEER